ncbi:VOC family protein [Chitinophaga niabensis]|uniref:Glyoxalase/Bleomycin resistance protein/Dioxygenase superfamily protein n=1 Tax=Chitinophaga niabensis TaxID=536979 RepID=A0A1N6DEW8_9BACT|nr:VOC family protein [Chitinophaga niabensis]SIN69335.1 Glyoxalase/Bleomycin resistance protein/Dioxygenase superfamily protein [Chitinophaga niabensis]
MKPKINFITLSVKDLKRSTAFYRHVLGLPTQGIQPGYEDHVLFELENDFSLVLLASDKAVMPAGLIISHVTENKSDVDHILDAVIEAGATQIGERRNEAWGYTANFADFDGYQWEILCISK